MPDYYLYTYLIMEYLFFDPDIVSIKMEECDLKYNQELPKDELIEIISDGEWNSEEYKLKYKKNISSIFMPRTATIRKFVRLHRLNQCSQ
jgi:hypothetical protein